MSGVRLAFGVLPLLASRCVTRPSVPIPPAPEPPASWRGCTSDTDCKGGPPTQPRAARPRTRRGSAACPSEEDRFHGTS